jgi:hypothetical protein
VRQPDSPRRAQFASMRAYLREHSLTLTMVGLFALALVGQSLTGLSVFNDERQAHGEASVGLAEYFTTGHFGEALFENWESEFLQMGLFVLLTARLRQRGSPESKPFVEEGDKPSSVDREPNPKRPGAPWPVRRDGVILRIYEHSLSIALLALFALSFALHVAAGAAEYSADQAGHGGEPVSPVAYLGTAQLWFESFQNWQSEFMSIAALAVLSIFLREKGSSQSKPVDAPHGETGE